MPQGSDNRIEDVKRHLYDRENTMASRPREGILHPVSHDVPESWHPKTTETVAPISTMRKPRTSALKKFFIGALIFFFCAIAFSVYMYFTGGVSVSNDNIDISVLGNAFTKGGEELPIQIEITNRNKSSLELADLLVEYPRGAEDDPTDVIRLPRVSIGTIAPGQTVTETVKVTLYGDQQSTRTVKISLDYHPQGSNAIFTKEKEYPVTISTAPISLLINAPATATSEQAVSFTVTASLNTTLPQGGTMLQISYPSNFVFTQAAPAPVVNNNVWDISGLTQTNPISITVQGRFIGQDGDQQNFHVYAGTASPSDRSKVAVVYNSLLQTVSITKPFLEAHILVDNQDLQNYTASSDETIHGQVLWSNNLPTQITNGQIIVSFSGNAFDKESVDSLEGFYDSQNSQIIWDKNSEQNLGSIEPGASGSVNFTFKPLSLIGASSTLKSPQIMLSVSIKGTQPSEGTVLSDVNNVSTKIVKILSDFQLATSAIHSQGPLPPVAEQKTQYAVTWTLSNSANTILQAQARSILPVYVTWVGKQGGNENISYNETTREVIWNIGTVNPNTGFTSNREATFLISLTPSLSQVGSVPQLMKEVVLSGQDAFAGVQVKSSKGPITTSLPNDPTFKYGDERVIK